MTDRTPTLSASLHFIAFRAGETTAIVKTTPPSHTPAETTCRVWMTVLKAPPFLYREDPAGLGPPVVGEGGVERARGRLPPLPLPPVLAPLKTNTARIGAYISSADYA